jgi:hypothetical protein
MRVPFALRAVAAIAVSAAALPAQQVAYAAPSATATSLSASAPASWVGAYRLTFAGSTGSLLDVRVIVEPAGDRVVGLLVVDQHASGITAIRTDGDTLRAQIVAEEGKGELVLRNTADGVAGTLTIGKRVWQVNGARSF